MHILSPETDNCHSWISTRKYQYFLVENSTLSGAMIQRLVQRNSIQIWEEQPLAHSGVEHQIYSHLISPQNISDLGTNFKPKSDKISTPVQKDLPKKEMLKEQDFLKDFWKSFFFFFSPISMMIYRCTVTTIINIYIATDKRGIHIIFFLFLHENICCWYSLEAPRRGASNEYQQHMFSWRNKKDISIYLLLCI